LPVYVAADVELIAVNFLRGRAEITALVGSRVYTEVPAEPTFPLLTVQRIGGLVDWPGWLDTARLQVDAWAATKYAARTLAATALAVLLEMPGIYAQGVITHVTQDLGLTWSPDETTDRPRYVLGVAVTTHPIPA
jgi:hypothetical protein